MSNVNILINRPKSVCANCGLGFLTDLQSDCEICLGYHFTKFEQYIKRNNNEVTY